MPIIIRKKVICYLLFLLTVNFGLASAQSLYQWTDSEGTVHYTSNPANIPDSFQKPNATGNKQQNNLSSSKWKHGEYKDEMRGTTHKFAYVESKNTVNFDFPYHGIQQGTLSISDIGALFYIQKGQIICQDGYEHGTCYVQVKFDNGGVQYVNASTSGDKSTTLSIKDEKFLENIKICKTLMMQIEVYHNGYPVFNFDLR